MTNNKFETRQSIYNAIADNWSDRSHCYQPGWSDERIAEEMAHSIEMVSECRCFMFGHLRDPLIDIRDKLKVVEQQHAKITNTMTKFLQWQRFHESQLTEIKALIDGLTTPPKKTRAKKR